MASRIIKFLILFISCTLVASCNALPSNPLTIQLMNRNSFQNNGDLEIKACFTQAIDISKLDVHIYLTENPAWRDTFGPGDFEKYFDPQTASVPGTLSQSIPEKQWHSIPDTYCHEATLENIFLEIPLWRERGMCPFTGIITVASYENGRWNASDSIECQLDRG